MVNKWEEHAMTTTKHMDTVFALSLPRSHLSLRCKVAKGNAGKQEPKTNLE